MAKAKKSPVEEVVEEATREMREEIAEETENFENDGESLGFEATETLATDVFEEGFKKAIARKDSPRFHIKKNSQFLTVKDYPYSWEQLQKEYGPGYYQVICKARSNGWILKSQTEMVGDPNEGRAPVAEEEATTQTQDSNLAVLGFLQSSQERADQRAREMAAKSENGIASMMQTFMMAQQESNKTMMTLMMEQSKTTQTLMMSMLQANQTKGPDPIMTLLTTLLTREPKETGPKATELVKMLEDAKRDAKKEAKEDARELREQARKLAEDMTPETSDQEESLSRTLLKTFVPILPQIMQGAQNPQFQAQQNPALQQGFAEQPDHGTRPAIPAPAHMRRPQPQQPAGQSPQNGARPVTPVQKTAPPPKVETLDARQKEMILQFVGQDIALAMMNEQPATQVAEAVLKKLENQGVPRQTVANGFKLEDFYAYADQFVPAESLNVAKAWLKEFYESIQKISKPEPKSPAPTVVPSDVKPAANGNGPGAATGREHSAEGAAGTNGKHGAGATAAVEPVPVVRSKDQRGTRAPAREPAKTL